MSTTEEAPPTGAVAPPPDLPNINALWAWLLVETLVANGVRHAVVSPGSRSTPLAIAAARHAGLSVTVHVDERSAAFFALGLARASGQPAALICTSGTAAVNYHPAVVEAFQSHVPLVVVTADRPPSLRDAGASQTIDQVRLYGSAVRSFHDLALPTASRHALQAMAARVAEACATAAGRPAGPVHLNVPLDEPLAPIPLDVESVRALSRTVHAPRHHVSRAAPLDRESFTALLAALSIARRPLILAGADAARDLATAHALLDLSRHTGIPVVADVASGLRGLAPEGALVCSCADAFLADPTWAQAPPDLVIRLGGWPIGKRVQTWAAALEAPVLLLQPDSTPRDPLAQARQVWVGDVSDALTRLSEQAAPACLPDWTARWAAAEASARLRLADPATPVPLEARALAAAAHALPAGGLICLSNSMPVRHADTMLGAGPAGVRAIAFRGANGIDGVTSAALGVACASGSPTLLATGDLAFLHDLGGLHAARHVAAAGGTLVILVLNNDGGAIFSHLPVAGTLPEFELLFGTPHGLSFAGACTLFGLPYQAAVSADEVAEAARGAIARGGVSVIELASDRPSGVAAQRATLALFAEGAI